MIAVGIGVGVVVLIVVIVILTKKHKKKPNVPKICRKMFQQCDVNNSCCTGLSCTTAGSSKLCLEPTISSSVGSFQIQLQNKYLIYDISQSTFKVITDVNPDQYWWSWDESVIRHMNVIDSNVHSVVLDGNYLADSKVSMSENSSTNNGKVILTSTDNKGGIFSSDYRYSMVLDQGNNPMWVKSLNVTDKDHVIFDLTTPTHKTCKSIGQTCSVDGDCCPPLSNCIDGKCSSCSGNPPTCAENENAICGKDGKWSCVSKCGNLTLKCDSNEDPICQETNGEWKWECQSKCNGLPRPQNCAQSVCTLEDGKYKYDCVENCGGTTKVRPPTSSELQPVSGYTKINNDQCAGNQPNKQCYKKGNDYKVLYYNCHSKTWQVDKVCGVSNKPSCGAGVDPQCIEKKPEYCNGESGQMWVCPPEPKTWCGYGSFDKLAQVSRVSIDGENKQTTIYTSEAGTPIYPTISFQKCSEAGQNTIKLDDGDKSGNIAGYLDVSSGGQATLYPSTSQVVIDGVSYQYNPKYDYYIPSESSVDPRLCIMDKNRCENGGEFNINTENQVSGHSNISKKDPRGVNSNFVPTFEEMRTIGSCKCISPYTGYDCSVDGGKYCNAPNGKATMSTTNAPYPGVSCECTGCSSGDRCQYGSNYCTSCSAGVPREDGSCECNDGFAGDKCQYSRENCNNHADPKPDGSCNKCDSGYNGDRCQYSRELTCNNNGTPKSDGTCSCDSGYNGSQCQYSRKVTCGGRGNPNSNGTCDCDKGYAGVGCIYSDETNCSGNGSVDGNGNCTCDRGYTGSTCNIHVGGSYSKIYGYDINHVIAKTSSVLLSNDTFVLQEEFGECKANINESYLSPNLDGIYTVTGNITLSGGDVYKFHIVKKNSEVSILQEQNVLNKTTTSITWTGELKKGDKLYLGLSDLIDTTTIYNIYMDMIII